VTYRVLLADDHPVFRDGLAFTLAQSSDIGVIDQAGDGAEAVRMSQEVTYDVVVMDVRMPRLDGVTATRTVVSSGAKVLILTMFEDDAVVLSAVKAGASGYLVKGADAGQVVSAVLAVAQGHAVFGRSLAGRLLETFSTPMQPLSRSLTEPEMEDLSRREREVLELLADGLTNGEIGARLFISPITVRNHVSHILMKLHVRDRREAMLKVHRP
jgi:DNA-binding NarL/FixJ family response regulator